jgi:hypothetical protein
VACAGIGLDHVVDSSIGQSLFEADFLLLWKTRVLDRPRDIHTPRYISQTDADCRVYRPQVATEKRRDAANRSGKAARRGQAGVAAHTIAGGAESFSFSVRP